MGRFVLRRLDDAWKVVEYPSVAMRVPSIPGPRHLVKDISAIGILDSLLQRPPAIYPLRGQIKRLLGGVPTETTGLVGHTGTPHPAQQHKIEVDLKKSALWLKGELCTVGSAETHFVHLVVSVGGSWISGTERTQAGDSISAIETTNKVRTVSRDLLQDFGRKPSVEEMAEAVRLLVDEVSWVCRRTSRRYRSIMGPATLI